jgi:hypothetical protein
MRYFNGYFLVTGPVTEPAKVQDAPASTELVRSALSRFADQGTSNRRQTAGG